MRRRVSRTIHPDNTDTPSLRCKGSSQSSIGHSSIMRACASPGSCRLSIISRTQHSSSTHPIRISSHHVFCIAVSRRPSTPWRASMTALRDGQHNRVCVGQVECGIKEYLPCHGLQRSKMSSRRKSRRSSECALWARETGLEQWTAEMWASRRRQSFGHGKTMQWRRHYMRTA